MYGKRCLVTGANGFLGRQLCSELKAAGWHIIAMLHTTPAKGPWDESLVVDLSCPLMLPPGTFREVDVVFHLAAIAHQTAPTWLYEAVNHQATLSLARLAIEEGCARFVFVSSSLATGEHDVVPQTELQIAWPVDPYGVSKRRAEEDLRLSYGAYVTIVRPPLIYGVGVKGNLRSMLHAVRAGWFPPPPLAGVRSMISVTDAARAIAVVADVPQAAGQLFYITDDEAYTARRLYDAMRIGMNLPACDWAVPEAVFRVAGKLGDVVNKVGMHPLVTSAMVGRLLDNNLFSSVHIKQICNWHATEKFEDVLPRMLGADYG